jgi:hypothetical protein
MVDFEKLKDKTQQEIITTAGFNQNQGTVFLYATSAGRINVCDVRENADFHKRPSLILDGAPKVIGGKASVFSKWTSAVSDARFVGDT